MHPLIEYKLIDTTEKLIAFLPFWRKLWRSDPHASPFQSPEWLLPWWRHFGNQQLCGIAILEREEPVGFLPFYVYHDLQKRQKQLLPVGVGTTDYLDGVFAPECQTQQIDAAVAQLRRSCRHDVFCAPQLPCHSRLLEAMNHGRRPGTFLSSADGCSRMPAVSFPELPQKIRRNAMYYRNRALRLGTLELVQADQSNWSAFFDDLKQLHTSSWNIRGEEGVLTDDRAVRWHREAIPLLLQAGLLRLMALRLNRETIAVLYSLIDRERKGRVQFFYITAYSPHHADLRPGTLLIAYAAEHAAREGVATVDMLRGDESYKQIWHMEKAPTWCITQFPEQAMVANQVHTESAA